MQLEVVLDDHMFPSYTSQKVKSKDATFADSMYFRFSVLNSATEWF